MARDAGSLPWRGDGAGVGSLAIVRDPHLKTWPIVRPALLPGAPRSARPVEVTIACGLLAAAVIVLALPHDPARLGAGISDALQRPVVLIPLGAAVAVALLACIRGWVFRSLLSVPGPIQVVSFEDATIAPPATAAAGVPTENPSDAVQLSMYFRQSLSRLRLTAPTSTPGARTSVDLVDLLETSKLDPKQPFAAIGRLLRLVRPTHAYEVKAKLLRREEAPCFGVALEVIVLPRRLTTLQTYWRDTWEDALDRAARGVSAQVVPRSHHSERGTWSAWRGLTLDEKLFDLHHQAQRLQTEQRYEEALEHYFEAVRRDPDNGYLRFALGSMQEELALYVDACMTYRAIPDAIDAATDDRRKNANERIKLLARYRQTVLLGFGERLAEQWLAPPPEAEESRRSEELRALRDCLRPELKAAFEALDVDGADVRRLRLKGPLDAALDELLDERPHLDGVRQPKRGGLGKPQERSERHDNRARRERRLHLFFQVLAAGQVRALLDDYAGCDPMKIERDLTATTLDLLPAWAELRVQRARELLRSETRRQALRDRPLGKPARRARCVKRCWPPRPEDVHALWDAAPRVKGLGLRERLDGSNEFNDHYNAACTYAAGLLTQRARHDMGDDDRVAALSEAAVEELKRAADAGGSHALALRWDWILSDDPDLAGLRAEPAFQRFESERLPSPRPAPVRPSSIVRLKASRYSVRLAWLCAARLEQVWHARAAETGPTEIHRALDWWSDEQAAWSLARQLALHHRHWQTRLRLIQEMQAFAERNGMPAFGVVHPKYSEQPIDGDRETVERAARRETHFSDLRMTILGKALSALDEGLPGADEWERRLKDLDDAGEPLSADARRRLAANRAATWGWLRQAFVQAPTSDERAREDFTATFEKVVHSLEHLPVDPPPPPPATPAAREAYAILAELARRRMAAVRSEERRMRPRRSQSGAGRNGHVPKPAEEPSPAP